VAIIVILQINYWISIIRHRMLKNIRKRIWSLKLWVGEAMKGTPTCSIKVMKLLNL
jgi:hypothetical protein